MKAFTAAHLVLDNAVPFLGLVSLHSSPASHTPPPPPPPPPHLPIGPVRLSNCGWVVRHKSKLAVHIYLLYGGMGGVLGAERSRGHRKPTSRLVRLIDVGAKSCLTMDAQHTPPLPRLCPTLPLTHIHKPSWTKDQSSRPLSSNLLHGHLVPFSRRELHYQNA